VTFSPRAIHGGTSPETEVFTLHGSGCHTTGSNVSEVRGGTLTITLHRANNSCGTVRESVPTAGTIVWSPPSIAPSQVSSPGYTVGVGPGGGDGFVEGGGAVVTGSFAGAHPQLSVYLNETADAFLAACRSSGVSSVAVANGSGTI